MLLGELVDRRRVLRNKLRFILASGLQLRCVLRLQMLQGSSVSGGSGGDGCVVRSGSGGEIGGVLALQLIRTRCGGSGIGLKLGNGSGRSGDFGSMSGAKSFDLSGSVVCGGSQRGNVAGLQGGEGVSSLLALGGGHGIELRLPVGVHRLNGGGVGCPEGLELGRMRSSLRLALSL